jgi:hypothetical protein
MVKYQFDFRLPLTIDKQRGTKMRTRSYYEVSCLGSTVLAGCVVAINIATFASIGVVGKPTANEIAVNRVNKGDRLLQLKLHVPPLQRMWPFRSDYGLDASQPLVLSPIPHTLTFTSAALFEVKRVLKLRPKREI